MRFTFLKTAALITAILALLLAYPMYAWIDSEMGTAILISGAIAISNVTVGVLILEYAFDKPTGLFMGIVFGSMIGRSVVVLIVFFVLLMTGTYHRASLALALMGFHVIFMVAEIAYVLKQFSRRRLDDLIKKERQRRVRMSMDRQRRLSQ